MKGYMYILECSDGSYYIGSTKDLAVRFHQHQNGEGANHTKNRLPVKLVYVEEFNRIDKAFYREKQIQGWSREKKEALINSKPELLHGLSECKNDSHFRNAANITSAFDSAQASVVSDVNPDASSLSEAETNDISNPIQ
jgi:predicted GIY-YIG superfamily endonuclease